VTGLDEVVEAAENVGEQPEQAVGSGVVLLQILVDGFGRAIGVDLGGDALPFGLIALAGRQPMASRRSLIGVSTISS
jgi:hypothetical protein